MKNSVQLSVVLLLLGLSNNGLAQPAPWINNPSLFVHWTNFDALPAPPSSYGYVFENNYVVSTDPDNPKIWSISSTNPLAYSEAVTNYVVPGEPPGYNARLNSAAFATYNDNPPGLFLGSDYGLLKLNPTNKSLDLIWLWAWDTLYIAGAGDRIDGIVVNWGGLSGIHLWATNTYTYIRGGTADTTRIYVDPVSKNYWTTASDMAVRMLDENHSVVFEDGGYSTNGGTSFSGIGTYTTTYYGDPHVQPIAMRDAYVYSPEIIILSEENGSGLYIGNLGGYFEPLNCPAQGGITVFNYNQATRLLIAGNSSGLYSTVLPAPSQTIPVLAIDRAVIVSWDVAAGDYILQATSDMASGSWTNLDTPVIQVGSKFQVAVPAETGMQFFRLAPASN